MVLKYKTIVIVSLSTIIIILSIAIIKINNDTNSTSSTFTEGVNTDKCQMLAVSLLYPEINQAISKHYGGEFVRGYELYNANVTINQLQGVGDFDVVVEVETYYGAHNPPYSIEKMTFKIELGQIPKLISYESIPK